MRNLNTLLSLAIVLFSSSCQFGDNQDVAINFPQEMPQAHFASEALLDPITGEGLSFILQKPFNVDDSKYAILLLTLNDVETVKKYGFSMPSGLKEEGLSMPLFTRRADILFDF